MVSFIMSMVLKESIHYYTFNTHCLFYSEYRVSASDEP